MSNAPINHPGSWVRKNVLPTGITVTEAAKRLGVSRPTLSDFLNGKASLSPDMATKLAKAFGADADDLVRRQAEYDRTLARGREASIAVRAYTQSALSITAMQIEAWAEKLSSRAEMAVLLRRLVHSTGEALSHVDFPGHENSQRHGWDGVVSAGAVTPWIPLGDSGWEFGVNEDPRAKAEGDYASRTEEMPFVERQKMTFVFVTPRNWAKKTAWETAKRAEGAWKDVRVLDASDLEQWLETSVAAQTWLGAALPLRAEGISSPDTEWTTWSAVSPQPTPPLPKSLFQPVAGVVGRKLAEWLSQPPGRPFVIAADSADEALAAFVSACDTPEVVDHGLGDRAIVVRSAVALSKAVAAANSKAVIVVASLEAQGAASGTHRTRHMVIVSSSSSLDTPADISIGLTDEQVFRTSLAEIGFNSSRIEQLANESGLSRTVLRRRLSVVPAIRFPHWANDNAAARHLIPLMLVGHWNSKVPADQAILSDLSGVPYPEVEIAVADLVAVEDSPLWTVGEVRGVVSKIDALYAVAGKMTADDLERFFKVVYLVLSETDPSLDLPEDKRWAASLYGKTRQHSPLLRAGVCETLVLLAVHGNNLLHGRLGIDVEAQVGQLIRSLLTPLDGATWRSQEHDLPRYAEAAPKVFLDILDTDLRSTNPKVHALMTPAGSAPFSSPARTGLLWALEVLAWSPRWLPRVVDILARLSRIPLEDNWVNKPENSLLSIFRALMPQTAVLVDERIAALEGLVERYPDVAWRICLAQVQNWPEPGHYSSRPRWRSDATAAGEPVTDGETGVTRRKALDIVLAWQSHNERTLGDLVEHVTLPPAEQERLWDEVMKWAASDAADERKAILRERIRRATMTLPGQRRRQGKGISKRALDAYDALTPSDPVLAYRWLFEQHWIQESIAELEVDEMNIEARARRIAALRDDALRHVWKATGFDGVLRLCVSSGAAYVIGHHLADGVLTPEEIRKVAVDLAVITDTPDYRIGECLAGLLAAMDVAARSALLDEVIRKSLEPVDVASPIVDTLLRCAPFNSETWAYVDQLPQVRRARYWRKVPVQPLLREQPDEINRVVDELLAVDRPRTAFNATEMAFQKITTARLVRLLHESATNPSEPLGQQQLQPHYISSALTELSKRTDVIPDDLVKLEFLYLEGLAHTEHGIKNLEKAIASTPELFIQMLTFAFRREDDGEDPPELQASNESSRENLATTAYRALDRTKFLPGTEADGVINLEKLRAWVQTVRKLAEGFGRTRVADSRIGALLAGSCSGEDGVWPAEAVREVLEEFGNDELAGGFRTARYNARGAVWRAPGGAQERQLVDQYRGWAQRIANRYPFTARVLEDMALTYEGEAEWHDRDEAVRRRLRH